MFNRKNILKLIIGGIALILIVILVIKLIKVPTFILPPAYLTVMYIAGLIIGSLIVAGIVKTIFRKASFFILLCFIISISSAVFLGKLCSPTLTIIVPKGYVGQVALVLSNVDKDILSVDSNGIGYITKRTFDKVYTKPIVLETDGTDISNQTVGFNPSTFWGKTVPGTHRDNNYQTGLEIDFISFEIVPKEKQGQKQYYSIDLAKFADKAKLYKIE